MRAIDVALILTTAVIVVLVTGVMRVESFEGNANAVEILLFSAKWCGHCSAYAASGTFDRFSAATKYVTCKTLDADKHKDMVSKYGVEGYPWIVAVEASTGDKLLDFKGDRNDLGALARFAQDASDLELSRHMISVK